MEINLIIAIIILIICIVLAYKNKNSGSLGKITILLTGLFFSIAILVYPLSKEMGETTIQRIIFSILYSIQCIYVGQDFSLVQGQELLDNFSSLYMLIIYVSFLLAPVLTTGVILSLLENFLHKIMYKLSFYDPLKKEIHIFSSITKESVTLAESINNPKTTILFCNDKENEVKESLKERIRAIGAITIKESENEINVKNKRTFFYEISENEIKNIDNGIKLIEKYQDCENVKVTVFSTRKEAELLLDSVNRRMRVALVNRDNYAMYNLLSDRPILKWTKNKKISILVAGEENRTIEIIKIILWSMQLDEYDLEIHVVGENANHIKTMFYHQCPGIKEEKYKVIFHNADLQTEEFDKVLNEECQDVNYIILAMKEDELNIETGIFLREYYLYADKESYSNKPAINIWLNDEIKGIDDLGISEKNYVRTAEKNPKIYYEIHSFGTTEQIFKEVSILNSKLEDFALLCHLANVNVLHKSKKEQQKDIDTYNNREKTRKYSISAAIHMKYCLYAKGIDLFKNEITPELIKEVEKLTTNDEEVASFMRSYARMWNVFWRTEGYRRVSFEEATIYYKKGVTKSQQHAMAKLNPCLSDAEEFAENARKMSEMYGRPVDLVGADRIYIQCFPDILKKLSK